MYIIIAAAVCSWCCGREAAGAEGNIECYNNYNRFNYKFLINTYRLFFYN